MAKKLTAKETLFCKEYLVDLNATQAAIRAGYSKNSAKEIGHENLTKPHLLTLINEFKAERANKVEVNAAWVLKRFIEISDRCMQAEPVMISDGNGGWGESGEYRFDATGANKATEMIGKHIGFFEKDNEQGKPVIQTAPTTVYVNGAPPLARCESDIDK